MADIFLSYASEDRERARQLAVAFDARGWTLWWDRNIAVGRTFDDAIERELQQARCIVVLWSKASVSSEWVRNEAAVAVEKGTLFPVRIDDVKLPLEFRRRQTIDLLDWTGDVSHAGFSALCEGIATVVDASPGQVAEQRPPAPVNRARRRWMALALAAVVVLAAAAAMWMRQLDPDTLNAKLLAAADKGEAATVRTLIGKGADLQRIGPAALKAAADSRYWGSHSSVTEAGQLETLRALLESGVDPNTRDAEGLTPLMLVVRGRTESPAAIKALLDRGADVHAKCDCSACDPRSGSQGCNALMIAASVGHREIVQILLGAGARVNDKTEQGHTALMLTERSDIVRTLLQWGADPDMRDDHGRTALIWAARENVPDEAVAALIGAHANMQFEDSQGLTALGWAAIQGRTAVVRALLDSGADLNRKSAAGMTPLMLATINGRTDIVRLLVERRASLNELNRAGKTAMQLAHERLKGDTRDEVVYMLRKAGAK
ncbi:MAG TPA: ankyrin repeat domain-containing protein [Burkholderiaceae bacterium]|nr:ankyrin repeat domain-containing protein [Burkholderiaceae bacterium]